MSKIRKKVKTYLNTFARQLFGSDRSFRSHFVRPSVHYFSEKLGAQGVTVSLQSSATHSFSHQTVEAWNTSCFTSDVWYFCLNVVGRAGECPPSVHVSDDDGDSGSDIKMPRLWWSVMVTPVTGQWKHWITFKIQNIDSKFLSAIEEAFVPK